MFNKINIFSLKENLSPLISTVKKLCRSIILPKKHVYEYLDIIFVKLKQGEDIASAIKTVEEKKYAFFPRKYNHYAIKQFYTSVKKNWESSENPHLADVMEDYLDEIELMILRSSDTSSIAISMILDNHNKSSSNIKTLIMAATAPIIYILIIIVLASASHGSLILPIVATIEQAGKTPIGELATLISLNEFIINNRELIIPLIFIIALAYKATFEIYVHESRVLTEKIFILGLPYRIHRANTSVLFLQTMATLTKAGFPMAKVLKTIIEYGSPFTAHEAKKIQSNFSITGQISDSLNTSLFTVDTNFKLSVYLETKTPAKYMELIAEKISEVVTSKILFISRTINITGMIAIASYILLLVLANFSINDYLSN
ncbi:bacterial type II secretion system protein F domain protein [Aliivibrio fischeri]|uniref:type II secretion system F family protein n=1 Tax=Aliivibrio fischeri TaxID=668 RepID=UPI0012D98AAD|nr:type II secretion system F family protein [Aliivibrio fischeri]MUK37620.1 bacterial type II secretion system protein F domain protein [Aliivibrio fischeri]